MQSLLYFTGLVLATILWGIIFYKKDYHPQPISVLLQIFWIGLLGIAPVFAYQFIYQHYFPFLSSYKIVQPLFASSFLSGLMSVLFSVCLLALLLFLLSFVLTLILTLFSRTTLSNSYRALRDEPLNFLAVSVIMVTFLFLQNVFQRWVSFPILTAASSSLIFLVIIEEYVKHLMVRLVDDKKLKQVDDAITLSVMVGLAFAFIETILYAFMAGELDLIPYRIFLSMPVHLVASGIFGYFYGLAHFAQPITAQLSGRQRFFHFLHRVLMLKKATVYREEKMLEGLLLATVFHSLCNVLFDLGLAFIVVPMIVAGLWIIFVLYDEKMSRKVWAVKPRGV